MLACEQAPGLNMLQHGIAVHEQYLRLLETAEPWLVERQLPLSITKRYHIYHDCGKHLVLEVGEDGRRRFPGHAKASAEQYRAVFPGDEIVADLIERDMDFHTCRGGELDALCMHPHAASLYLTAWAEINANAKMFGGRDSESYKIKASRLKKAGKKLRAMMT